MLFRLLKWLVILAVLIGLVALIRSKLGGATWAAAWNDNFGGLVRVGPKAAP